PDAHSEEHSHPSHNPSYKTDTGPEVTAPSHNLTFDCHPSQKQLSSGINETYVPLKSACKPGQQTGFQILPGLLFFHQGKEQTISLYFVLSKTNRDHYQGKQASTPVSKL
ncbi:hypothetical protein P7K49_013309, partial [Saguinus oedipus]